jgi:thiol:disulfide interchange protein
MFLPTSLVRSAIATALLAASAWAQALDIQAFSDSALAQAQKDGRAVAVHFHADWCSTCKLQSKSLQALQSDDALKSVTVLVADYDKEKALKKRMNVRSQSVLVVYRGEKERARVAGETTPEALGKALKAAL